MQMCRRKQVCPTHVANHTDLRIKLDRFLRMWLDARIGLYMLSCTAPALQVPLVVVVPARSVFQSDCPIGWMNCHAVFGGDIVDGHPPIDLAEWRRIPG